MSRLSITTRSVQCVRLSPEGDDIGAYFHFPRQIFFSENAVDKREETRRNGIRRGGASDFQPSLSLSWRFLFYVLSPLSMFTCSQFFSLQFPSPAFFQRFRHFAREAHNNGNTIFTWHTMPGSKSPINKGFISQEPKRKCSISCFSPSVIYFRYIYKIHPFFARFLV